jgi:hypothetical protein
MRAFGGIQVLVGLALLAGCSLHKPSGSLAKLDEKNGFRDVRLLTPLTEFNDLEFVELKNGMGCFKRPKEDLVVGDATVGSIRYCFYKGRLGSVSLWGAGAKTAGELWKGEKVTAVLLFVEHRTFPQMDMSEVVVTLSANEILEEMDAAGQVEDLVGNGEQLPPTP